MLHEEDLPVFVKKLQARGLSTRVEAVCGRDRVEPGIQVGEHFYPLWELNHPQNSALLSYFDFNGIRNRRGADWSVSPPSEAEGPG